MINGKDQVLDYFQKFDVIVEQKIGLSLKVVRSNNGANTQIHLRSTAESMRSSLKGQFLRHRSKMDPQRE